MKETRLRKILDYSVYKALIAKYKMFIKNGDKDKALALKAITYASLYPQLLEDGRNPWREPNDFLENIGKLDNFFEMYYETVCHTNYRLFGKRVEDIKTKLI